MAGEKAERKIRFSYFGIKVEDRSMERDHLFKGKIKGSKTGHEEMDWAFGNLIKELSSGRCFICDLSHFNDSTKLVDVLIEVNPETVCQCIGQNDKNGNIIFENDIIKAHLDDQYPEIITYAKVVWNGFAWCTAESTECEVMSDWDLEVFEICGNIFDNPDLLSREMP